MSPDPYATPERRALRALVQRGFHRLNGLFGRLQVARFHRRRGGVEVEHHLSLGAPQNYEAKGRYLLRWKPEDAIVFGRG